jgi:hypothetical protein
MRKNPYGIKASTGKGYSVSRCMTPGAKSQSGERIHLIVGGHAACDKHLKPDGRTSPRIRAGEFDCYRCIKIAYMENQASKKAFVERTFRPSEPSKREKHLMLPGGRSGRYIGKKAPKDKSRLDRKHMEGRGYMAADISESYGPEHLEYMERGPDYAPAQIRVIPFAKVRGMAAKKKAAAKYRKIANPGKVSFTTKDGRKVSFATKKNGKKKSGSRR